MQDYLKYCRGLVLGCLGLFASGPWQARLKKADAEFRALWQTQRWAE
jgi:hypothetical protein